MIELWALGLLFLTGCAAGFVDSVAGGGGLITLPVLLSIGMSPAEALGTNKLQATFGSFSAAVHYTRAGLVRAEDCWRGFLYSVSGAAAGALAVRQMSPAFLRAAIPVLLLLVTAYLLLRPKLGDEPRPASMPRHAFELFFGLGLGFYDGFFGPGTGTFWTMACMLWLGMSLRHATGYTKVMNFGSNISSLVMFLLAGKVLFGAGLVMGAGQCAGAYLGSRMVITRGVKFIRPMLLAVTVTLALRLLLTR